MDLVKNYPWVKSLVVSEKDFEKWKAEGVEESFTFWSLQNKIINQRTYFDWAVEQYQIPFLEDMFFEQHLMKKSEWEKLENIADWTPEVLPVAVWKDTVFIGCVELPLAEKQTFKFKHQFVLISSKSLQTMWNFTKELTRAINEEREHTLPQLDNKINIKSNEKHLEPTLKGLTTQKESHSMEKTKADPLSGHNKKAFTPELPSEKKPLLVDPIPQPSVKGITTATDTAIATATDTVIATTLKTTNTIKTKDINSEVVKVESSLPEPEKERAVDLENNTFPGRFPEEENNNLIMGNFESKTSAVKKTPVDQQLPDSLPQLNSDIKSNPDEITIASHTKTGAEHTGIIAISNHSMNYKTLWKQTQSIFVTSMILQVKKDKIYPLVWSGRIQIEQTNAELMDLKDNSLFKVLQRGYPYHGFVVQLPANKKFFEKIGWKKYPKHITAIPIKNEKQELRKIFLGIGISHLYRDKISSIEKIVSDFFQSQNRKIVQAA